MSARRVTHTRKNPDGSIAALCNPEEWWSPRPRADAILDIERHQHRYCVLWPGHGETEIRVVNGPTGRRLHTDRDTTQHNNLTDLPHC